MSQLANKDMCTGCTACASVCPKQCIEIKKDENGFAFPEVSDVTSCIKCGACERICPILSKKGDYETLPDAYAAYSMDESLRMESSSGGIFSEIAKLIIEKNGVVYGAAYNQDFEVYHCCVKTIDDLSKLQGAKYSESYLGNTFSEILERIQQGQSVLFAGTPCQIAGLKAFVKKDYSNLICIDFVCHGVPSPMVWKKYVDYRAIKDADGEMPISINLRSKISGWSRYQYSNVFQYADGKDYSSVSSQNLFMKLFVGDYISRSSCENCAFKGYNRDSDITLGDFWGIWDIAPEMDDNKGTSVVLVHSESGKACWNEIDKRIKYKQVNLEQASRQNQSMLLASKSKPNRAEVLSIIREENIEECNNLFIVKKQFFIKRVINKVKRLTRKEIKR